MTRPLRLLGVLTAVLAMLVSLTFAGVSPRAGADPEPTENPAPTDTLTVSWVDLGTSGALSFYGRSSSTTLTIPVPAGLTPVSMNATVDLPFNMRSGVLTVMQDDRVITKLGLPLTDLAPIVIPLAGLEVVGPTATVELSLSSLPDDGYCLDENNAIDLINGSVTFTGTESTPTTVADFLPPLLRQLTIAVPAKPSQTESDAAVVLATTLVAKYRNQPLRVVVVALPDGASTLDGSSAPFERRIAVKEGPDAGLSLRGSGGVPQLLITGTGVKLVNQARLLSDSSLGVAVSANVVAGELHSRRALPGNAVTLAELGQATTTSVGLPPQVSISLDQSRFGHPTRGFRLHLLGSYTPVPGNLGGLVTVTANGETVDSWVAETNGVIDRWVDIPDRLVQRFTEVMVGLAAAGDTGSCDDFDPLTLTIMGSSVVESSPAMPPIPPGFGSLPQALMPTTMVGIGDNSFADTVRAAQITTGLQRLSVVPLVTEVVPVKQALSTRGPAVVISPDGWTDPSIPLPVRADGSRLTLEGPQSDRTKDAEPTTLTLDPAVPFGSLQTVFDGRRSLLIATSTAAPDQLDELLRWLDSDPRRWKELRGSAIVAFQGREPTAVAGRTPPTIYGPALSQEKNDGVATHYEGSPAWWVAAAVVLAAGAGVAAIVISARRSATGQNGSRRRRR